MKAISLFLVLIFSGVVGKSQSFDKIEEALGTGNVSALVKHMDKAVDLSLDGVDRELNQSDAENELRKFLTGMSIEGFERMHSGKSKNEIAYMIGVLHTSEGDMRVSVYAKSGETSHIIESLEITKE